MIRLELNKSIEAKRLHKRTGAPLPDPEVVIPYGAIVENVEQDRDYVRFAYLRETYRCTHTLLASATDPRAWKAQLEGTAEPEPAAEPAAAAAPAPAAETGSTDAAPAVPAGPALQWTALQSGRVALVRTKVPGGWLIAAPSGASLAFYPDAKHEWDGGSLD